MSKTLNGIAGAAGRLVHHAPAIGIGIVAAMVFFSVAAGLLLGQLYVSAGGDWSWELFTTIVVGGFALGLVFVFATLLRASGLQSARSKWVGLVGIVILAGMLMSAIGQVPTASAHGSSFLRIGLAVVVVGTSLRFLLGENRAMKPLLLIGGVLLALGALSGVSKAWGDRPAKSSRVSAVSAYPCSFRNTSGKYPARVLGPGRFEFVWEGGLGRSTYEFDASARGTWQQVYPERSGAVVLSSVAPEIFSGASVHGLSMDENGVKYPFILECPASVLAGLNPH